MSNIIPFVLVFAVACTASILTFVVVYLLWLRVVLRRLVEVQALLRNVSHNLKQQEETLASRQSLTRVEKTRSSPRLQMSVEGKSVAILEINGHDVVRFQENLSEQQKKRIIEYLKVEGFITAPRAD